MLNRNELLILQLDNNELDLRKLLLKGRFYYRIEHLLNITFKPEFINRIDAVVVYKPLTLTIMDKIVDIQILQVAKRLKEQGVDIKFTKLAKAYLAKKGYDPVFGARPLKRLIDDEVLDEIALQIIENKIGAGDSIKVDKKEKGAGLSVKVSYVN